MKSILKTEKNMVMTKSKQVMHPWSEAHVEGLLFPERELFQSLRKKAEVEHVPVISRELGSLLQLLIRIKSPDFILELGTGYGLASLLMAEAAPKAIIDSFEINQVRYSEAKNYIREANRSSQIRCCHGDIRLAECRELFKESYDIILVDAAKAQYSKLLDILTPYLKSDGVIVFTDIYLKGRLFSGRIEKHRQKTALFRMRAFIQEAQESNAYHSHIIDVDDGLLIMTRKEEEYG